MGKRTFGQKSSFEILDHGINFAIKLAKKTLKSQFSGISTDTGNGKFRKLKYFDFRTVHFIFIKCLEL